MKESYTAAGEYPIKLFQNNIFFENTKIIPYHIQLNPTNACNLNCSFCSCSRRDRNSQLSIRDIIDLLSIVKSYGCRAITITGGGEPILHPNINSIISLIYYTTNIKIGLVSNGIIIDKLDKVIANNAITWCRISFSDERNLNKSFIRTLKNTIKKCDKIDWAFSYVVTNKFDVDKLSNIIEFANKNNFTHIRLVSDLLDLDNIPRMDAIRKELRNNKINDSIVIYQDRKDFIKGRKKCLISLLKPVISAERKIYPCCGIQYVSENPALDYPSDLSMGTIDDLDDIIWDQKYFDGSICHRCYYDKYNEVLDTATKEISHAEFV